VALYERITRVFAEAGAAMRPRHVCDALAMFTEARLYRGDGPSLRQQNYPASNLITRRILGWEPAQPSLLDDLDNGHYFSAD
jgi:hypothetical protein